jgi:hypothetical protein
MPITVVWDNDQKTILHYTYTGKWTWAEYEAVVDQAAQLVKDIDYQIDVIADFSETSLLPDQAIHGFKKSLDTRPINFGVAVLVTQRIFITRLVDAFSRLYRKIGQKLVIAPSVSEARAILAQRQNTPTKPQ